MAKHTPGEWEAVPPKHAGKHWKVCANGVLGGDDVLWSVAAILNGAPGDTLETEEANARLIAAAKDLLAACESAKTLLGLMGLAKTNPMYAELAAVIARATGT